MIMLRDQATTLMRMKTGIRSADVSVINRGFSHMLDPNAGLQGNSSDGTITHVRLDFNKTWHTSGRFSEWKCLGDYLHDEDGFVDEYSLCCVRTAVEIYFRRTQGLPLAPWVDEIRPLEQVYRLFVTDTAPAPSHKHRGLTGDTVAGRIKKFMIAAGVDTAYFKPHVLRSASIKARLSIGESIDKVLSMAGVSKKVFSVFYDLPIGGVSSGAGPSVEGAAVGRLALGAAPSSAVAPGDAIVDAPATGPLQLMDRSVIGGSSVS